MKYIKLFESFEDIDSICKEYRLSNYTINDDGSVDVDNSVYLSNESFSKLPLKFRNVEGFFDCDNNNLTTLEGCPESVGGGFYCFKNRLTILEGCPESVGGDFDCRYNQIRTLEGFPNYMLTSLEGFPERIGRNIFLSQNSMLTSLGGFIKYVGRDFDVINCSLKSLKGSPEYVGGDFNCRGNKITSLEGCSEHIGGDLRCGLNKITSLEGCPSIIGNQLECVNNEIRTFEGFPRNFRDSIQFFCDANPIHNLWLLFRDKDKVELFNDFGITDGEVIILERLNEFLEMVGKPTVMKNSLICRFFENEGYRII